MSDLLQLQELIATFSNKRNWEMYHTPKNLAMAIAGEAGELVAEFQWMTPDQAKYENLSNDQIDAIRFEMADVGIYLIRLADVLKIDLKQAILDKVAINEKRFS